MDISIIIVAFKSDHILQNLIKNIPSQHEIIVIENSLQSETKKVLETQFSNLKVIIPDENLGYSRGVNLGVKESKNNHVFVLTADVSFKKEMFQSFEKILDEFNNFALLAPVYENSAEHKNFKIFHNNKINKIMIQNFMLKEVDEIDGAFLVLNKKEFKTNKIMDENYFLYFDSTDLCHQLKKNNQKMYVVENLTFIHKGTASTKKEYEFEILINRNWHYSWSKFYFYKKNKNYFFALKKVSPNFFRSLVRYLYFKIIFDKKNAKLHAAIVSGIFNAILLRKSFFRPNI